MRVNGQRMARHMCSIFSVIMAMCLHCAPSRASTLAFLNRRAQLSYFLHRAQGAKGEGSLLLSLLQSCSRESPPSLTLPTKPYPSLCYPSLINLPWGSRAGVMKGLTFRVGRAGHRSCIFLFLTFIQCPLLLMLILKS